MIFHSLLFYLLLVSTQVSAALRKGSRRTTLVTKNNVNTADVNSALAYIGVNGVDKHRGQPYTYTCNTLNEWKNSRFPNSEIAVDLVWNLTHDYYAPDGNYRSLFLINGQAPGPSIVANEGDWIRVVVNNYLPVPITIHFHGIDQFYTPWSDGMPGVTQYPILSGGTYAYIFQFRSQHGAFWYHAHYRSYFQDGIYGPIYIIPSDDIARPYKKIPGLAPSDIDYFKTTLEKVPINLIVSDGFTRTSDDVLVKMFHQGVLPICTQSILINGKGRVTCQSSSDVTAASKARGDIFLGQVPTFDAMGCARFAAVTAQDVALEAPGSFSSCTGTSSDREIIYTDGASYLYFNVFNMAGEYGKTFGIDEHDLIVIAVDGMFCEPYIVQQLKIPLATRFTVVVKTKSNVAAGTVYGLRFATYETFQVIEGLGFLVYGSAGDTSAIQALTDAPSTRVQDIGGTLTSSSDKSIEFEDLKPYGSEYTPSTKDKADHTIHLVMNATSGIHFSLFEGKDLFIEAREMDTPYLLQTDPAKLDFDNIEGCLNPGAKLGEVIDIIIDNPSILNHPYHMHGHSFSVIGRSATEAFKYTDVAAAIKANKTSIDFEGAPFVDAVEVAAGGHAVIRFTAKNPGYWFMHCHINHHLAGGMGGFIVIDPRKIPPIPLPLYAQPHTDYDSAIDLDVSEPEND